MTAAHIWGWRRPGVLHIQKAESWGELRIEAGKKKDVLVNYHCTRTSWVHAGVASIAVSVGRIMVLKSEPGPSLLPPPAPCPPFASLLPPILIASGEGCGQMESKWFGHFLLSSTVSKDYALGEKCQEARLAPYIHHDP